LLAANITIVAGSAGTGNLDSLLDATHGTITTTDDPGDPAATLSTGALASVGASVAINIAADNTIGFNDITSLNLLTGPGVSAAFSTRTGAITFTNVANTIHTVGGSLLFNAGTDLNIPNLATNGGDVSLTAGAGQVQVGTGASVQTNNGNITLRADAMTISAAVNAGGGMVTLAPATSGRPIDVGTNPSSGNLGLGQSDLSQVTASVLRIGDTVSAGNINITAAITAPVGWNTLDLRSNGSINELGGSITVTNLALQAAGQVNLDQTITGNDVAVLAGRVGNASAMFQYVDANAFTIGSVDGIDGVSTNNGSVFLAILGSQTLSVSHTAAAADVSSGGGLIQCTVDGVDLQTGSVINGGTGDVIVRNNDLNLPVNLGSPSSPGVLGLTNAELNTIVTSGTLRIGEINAADITISAPVVPLHVGAFELDTGAGITQDAGATITAPNLTISAASAVTLNEANDISGSLSATITSGGQGFSFAAASSLTVTGITTQDGAITVRTATGDLTVNNDVVSLGADIALTAAEGTAGTTNDLILNNSVSGANVTLQAGDGVEVPSAASVQASGTLTIDIGFGDNDNDGGAFDLQGQVTGTTVAVVGSPAADTFTVNTAGSSPLVLNGQGGADRYNLTPSTTTSISIAGGSATQPESVVNVDFVGLAVHLGPRVFTATGLQPIILGGTGNIAAIDVNNAASVNTFYGPDTADRAALNGLTTQERFVEVLYLDALGRVGARSELDTWVHFMNSVGGSQALVARDIEASPEGLDRLVKTWYQTFLGRTAAGGEESGWVNLLGRGTSEESVLSDILGSTEFLSHAQNLITSGTT
jgi:hypothetical protein